MQITDKAYWFPVVVISKTPIKSIEMKFIALKGIQGGVGHNFESANLLFGTEDNASQTVVQTSLDLFSNIVFLGIDTV